MRKERTCDGCIWRDQCGCGQTCDYYTPWDEDEENERFIEENRIAFMEEYAEYIAECC